MEERIGNLETKISILSKELFSLKDLIAACFTKVNDNFRAISGSLISIKVEINNLNFKIDNLDSSTSNGLNQVGTKIESLADEIQKINLVTQ